MPRDPSTIEYSGGADQPGLRNHPDTTATTSAIHPKRKDAEGGLRFRSVSNWIEPRATQPRLMAR